MHSGQRHGQSLVLVVRGHVGDALAAVVHLFGGADVEGRLVGGAGGAVTSLPPGVLGGSRRFRRRQGERGDDGPIQAGDAAGVAGEVLLRDGGAVRPILLTAVILQEDRSCWFKTATSAPTSFTKPPVNPPNPKTSERHSSGNSLKFKFNNTNQLN